MANSVSNVKVVAQVGVAAQSAKALQANAMIFFKIDPYYVLELFPFGTIILLL